MFDSLVEKFKRKPTIYYAASIVASWAGVGSLMNFRTLALNSGIVPAVIWAVFNSLACIVFGLVADKLPMMRKIMKSKFMFYFIGIMTFFQTWTQMSGIRDIFADTPITATGGIIIAFLTCAVFIIMLWKRGMIRNVLTDGASWVAVYALLLFVAIASFVYTKGEFVHAESGFTLASTANGIWKGFLLMPGPFTYPYYYEVFSYDEHNEDGVEHCNVKRSFIYAGIMFAIYMVFAAILTFVKFSPVMNVIKAILVTIIAISSLSTYLYSTYIVFGRKWGLALNVATVAGWPILIPLGVMGIWTIMSEIRLPVMLVCIIVAIVMQAVSSREKGK